MKERIPWLAVLLALLAVRPAAAQGGEDWRRFVGCYREGGLVFALDSLPGRGPFGEAAEAGVRRARPLDVEGHDDMPGGWRVLPPDSVVLRIPRSGLDGERRFVPRGDTLAGTAVIHPGVPMMGTRPARAVRTPCSSRCVIRGGHLVIEDASSGAPAPGRGDAPPLPYLAGAEWYARRSIVLFRGGRYVQDAVQTIPPDVLTRVGEHRGVALFAEAGRAWPEPLYALLRPGASCEFQMYQRV